CPVATTDYVTCTCHTKLDVRHLLDERMPVALDDQFSSTFRTRIDVLATHAVCLAITPNPFYIVVSLVRCDEDTGTIPVDFHNCLTNSSCTHDVGGHSIKRFTIGSKYQSLSSQVDEEVRTNLLHICVELLLVADVAIMLMNLLLQLQRL